MALQQQKVLKFHLIRLSIELPMRTMPEIFEIS